MNYAPANIVLPDANPTAIRTLERAGLLAELETHGSVRFFDDGPQPADEIIARARAASVLVTVEPLPSGVISSLADTLKLISFTGVGAANHVDLDEARSCGVVVTNTPGYGDRTVAEHTLMLILAGLRHCVFLDHQLRSGRWDQSRPGRDLAEQTVGIVGLGRIGSEVARLTSPLSSRLIAWTRSPGTKGNVVDIVELVTLRDLFQQADVVTVHLSLNESNRGLIGEELLRRMRPGSLLVNTARGELVDEGALVAAVQAGRISAALDVYADEPLSPEHPLLLSEGVTLTPHVAYNTPTALQNIMTIAVNNVRSYLEGRVENAI